MSSSFPFPRVWRPPQATAPSQTGVFSPGEKVTGRRYFTGYSGNDDATPWSSPEPSYDMNLWTNCCNFLCFIYLLCVRMIAVCMVTGGMAESPEGLVTTLSRSIFARTRVWRQLMHQEHPLRIVSA